MHTGSDSSQSSTISSSCEPLPSQSVSSSGPPSYQRSNSYMYSHSYNNSRSYLVVWPHETINTCAHNSLQLCHTCTDFSHTVVVTRNVALHSTSFPEWTRLKLLPIPILLPQVASQLKRAPLRNQIRRGQSKYSESYISSPHQTRSLHLTFQVPTPPTRGTRYP